MKVVINNEHRLALLLPPHAAADRDLVEEIDGWELRLFSGRRAEYFAPRGFWHLQLWSPRLRVSVLTPSRLTCGFYEACTADSAKRQAISYEVLLAKLPESVRVIAPRPSSVATLERTFVHDLLRAHATPAS